MDKFEVGFAYSLREIIRVFSYTLIFVWFILIEVVDFFRSKLPDGHPRLEWYIEKAHNNNLLI